MNSFIYVCTDEDRDALLARGYTLLRSDESSSMYIFARDGLEPFSLEGINYVESDTLLY